jgi:hypothetical protein
MQTCFMTDGEKENLFCLLFYFLIILDCFYPFINLEISVRVAICIESSKFSHPPSLS